MTSNNRVPFLDLVTPHQEMKEQLTSIFGSALASASFIGGPMVEKFENAFAEYCDQTYCVGVGSGTDALRFALIGAGVGSGEIVITVPNTFIATTEAITQAGGYPDFVDVSADTCNMNPIKLQEYLQCDCDVDAASGRLINRRLGRPVRAIVPVHLYGRPAEMDPILYLAEHYGLTVIEDACQAHGAEYYSRNEQRWRKAGSMGRAAAFSFYPGKNLGACGEGGAVVTGDKELARQVRMLRDHGQSEKYFHRMEGYNGRLDAIQAGILGAKLERLSEWNQQRREAAERYGKLLADLSESITLPSSSAKDRAVYHLYVIRSAHRNLLRESLAEAGIDTGIHYPVPLHLQEAYRELGYGQGAFPVTEMLAEEILSLPMFPNLQAEQQRRVAEEISKFAPAAAAARA